MPDCRPILAAPWRLAILLSLLITAQARGIDAGDMDPHLPDQAILSAMRFQSFSLTADSKVEWQRRHTGLLEELEEQLEVVALENTRAAAALRTLISDLKDAEFVQPKKRPEAPHGEYPVLADGNRVLVNTAFHIAKPESRVLTFPFKIESVPAKITVGIGGGSDDSGDKGLHYMLIDPVGRVIKRGAAKVDGFVWIDHLGTRLGTWKLVLQDLDTDLLDKENPGNRGAVEVLVKSE